MAFKLVTAVCGAFIMCLRPIAGFAQDDDIRDLVLDCRRHAEEEARLACYDELAYDLASADATAAAAGARERPATKTTSSAAASPRESTEEGDTTLTVKVVDCRRLYDNDYLFTLENGESWRQAGGQTLRLGDCKFDATIVKDFFGHKMTFDHNGQAVRVKRMQ